MRDTTPKYSLEVNCPGHYITPMAWNVKGKYGYPGDGKPTAENLAKWVQAFIDSHKPGGSNHHLSSMGTLPIPSYARIVLNDGSRTLVAEWKAPMFMAI
jgi:hypothetical protein